MTELKKILIFNNMVEANLMEKILKENNIPHLIRSFHDTAYDGIYQDQYGWGVVEAPEEYRNEIMKLYTKMLKDINTNVYQDKNNEDENYAESDNAGGPGISKKRKGESFKTARMIVIFCIIAIETITIIYLFNRLNQLSESRFYKNQWDQKTMTLTRINNINGNKLVLEDINENFIYELENKYNDKGILISRYIDSNENFIDEKIIKFNDAGQIIQEDYDDNEDLRFEKIILYYPDGTRLYLIDTNFDGTYDILKAENAEGKMKTFMLPKDLFKTK